MFTRCTFISCVCTLAALFLLSSCVAVGAAAGLTVAAVKTVVTVPVKVGGAVVDAVSDDEDEEDDEEESGKED
jgi:hypothetical protein